MESIEAVVEASEPSSSPTSDPSPWISDTSDAVEKDRLIRCPFSVHQLMQLSHATLIVRQLRLRVPLWFRQRREEWFQQVGRVQVPFVVLHTDTKGLNPIPKPITSKAPKEIRRPSWPWPWSLGIGLGPLALALALASVLYNE
jgi:hypothetical protein